MKVIFLDSENMLLDYKKDLKIIDFGLSNLYKKNEKLKKNYTVQTGADGKTVYVPLKTKSSR